MRKVRVEPILFALCKYIVLLLISVFLISPFIMMISNSFKTMAEIKTIKPTLIPSNITLKNYREIFNDRAFLIDLRNSFLVATIAACLAMIVAIPAAYSMARYKTRISRYLTLWIIASQMFPVISILVPLFLILKTMHLTNTLIGLIIVYAVWALPFTIWMLRGFVEGMPQQMEEAAFIDGCDMKGMFFYIILPTMLPGILTSAMFAFISAWNEFFFALTLMKTPQLQTITIKLNSYIGQSGNSREDLLAAASVIATIPAVLVFLVFQKFFVSGLTSGSEK